MSSNLNLLTLNEVHRRLSHQTPTITNSASSAGVLTAAASDPWIRGVDASTPILTSAGAGALRIRFLAYDGHGAPMDSAVIRILVGSIIWTSSTFNSGTELLISGAYYSLSGADARTGYEFVVLATSTGLVDITFAGLTQTANLRVVIDAGLKRATGTQSTT
jgi:hypothetical protein